MSQPLSFTEESARKAMRRKMRRARASLSAGQRHTAARGLARQLHALPELVRARRIGVYQPHGGELDVLSGLSGMVRRHRQLFLPALDPLRPGLLRFVAWTSDTQLVSNRFGIVEPCLRRHAATALWSLDVLLMPLVAFDEQGNRLGMGGGFYDRTLAELQRYPRRPALWGVAYDFQRVAALPVADWDVPLDGVITDSRIYARR